MKKTIIGVIFIIAFIGCIYGYVWNDSLQKSKVYMVQAEANFEKNDLAYALKGNEIFDEKSQTYQYIGGFEQVMSIWDNPWAVPKPAVYHEAQDRIHEIIYEKLTPEQGFAIVKSYLGLSNKYLPDILLEVGMKYIEQGHKDEAKEILQMLIEGFEREKAIVEQAKQALQRIE